MRAWVEVFRNEFGIALTATASMEVASMVIAIGRNLAAAAPPPVCPYFISDADVEPGFCQFHHCEAAGVMNNEDVASRREYNRAIRMHGCLNQQNERKFSNLGRATLLVR